MLVGTMTTVMSCTDLGFPTAHPCPTLCSQATLLTFVMVDTSMYRAFLSVRDLGRLFLTQSLYGGDAALVAEV